MLCPQQVDEIEHLDNQIKGGTTVVMALVYNRQLYVANVGDSRALLCSYVSVGFNQCSPQHTHTCTCMGDICSLFMHYCVTLMCD